MGNYSRETFNKLKHYVSVRLQQGVPLVDADWNEMEDIRRFELRAFLKWFVGDGVPYGNGGFEIVANANPTGIVDFTIMAGKQQGAGYCLVDGMDALINSNISFTKQQLYGNPKLANDWKVDNVPEIRVLKDRIDLVYLDVWEREVNASEDDKLINQAIGIETAVRLKREWVVRVLEDCKEKEVPAERLKTGQPKLGHAYYPLAQLGWQPIANLFVPTVINLRKVGLRMPTDDEIGQLVSDVRRLIDHFWLLEKKVDPLPNEIKQLATDSFGTGYALDRAVSPWPGISLRDAVNAAMWGRLPTTSERVLDFTVAIDSLNLIPSLKLPHDETLITFVQNNRVYLAGVNLDDKKTGLQPRLLSQSDAISKGCVALRVGNDIWVFWRSNSPDPNVWKIYYRICTEEFGMGPILPVTGGDISDSDHSLSAFCDSGKTIWLTWVHSDNHLRVSRYVNKDWITPVYVPGGSGSTSQKVFYPTTVEGNSDTVLVFWEEENSKGKTTIKYLRFTRGNTGDWNPGKTALLTGVDGYSEEYPIPLRDASGHIWLFWYESQSSDGGSYYYHIYYKLFSSGGDTGQSKVELLFEKSQTSIIPIVPVLFGAERGHISVFRMPSDGKIFYSNYDMLNYKWSDTLDLPSKLIGKPTSINDPLVASADGVGGAWLAYPINGAGNQYVFKKVYSRL